MAISSKPSSSLPPQNIIMPPLMENKQVFNHIWRIPRIREFHRCPRSRILPQVSSSQHIPNHLHRRLLRTSPPLHSENLLTLGLQAYGPLFPFAHYTLLNSFFISISSYTAIAFVTTFLIFPETLSHQWLATSIETLGRIRKLVEMQEDVLSADPMDGDLAPESELSRGIVGLKESMLGSYQNCKSCLCFRVVRLG